jgi:dihydrofolate reductase
MEMIARGFELAGETGAGEVMLIGGARLYAQLMRYCQRLYVTEVDAMIEGDAHFPAIPANEWREVSQTPYPKGEKDDYPFTVRVYERI